MAGMPANTQADVASNRLEYMSELALRAKLDDKVLQAVKLNKRTGLVPVPQTDFRTLEEKLADTERLKVELRVKLREIMDPTTAGNVISRLRAPEVSFIAQNLPEMIKYLKPRHAQGVPADIFIEYFKTYAAAAGFLAPGVPVGPPPLLDVLDMVTDDLIEALLDVVQDLGGSMELEAKLTFLKDVTPQLHHLRNLDDLADPVLRKQGLENVQAAFENVPTKSYFISMLEDLRRPGLAGEKLADLDFAISIDEGDVKLLEALWGDGPGSAHWRGAAAPPASPTALVPFPRALSPTRGAPLRSPYASTPLTSIPPDVFASLSPEAPRKRAPLAIEAESSYLVFPERDSLDGMNKARLVVVMNQVREVFPSPKDPLYLGSGGLTAIKQTKENMAEFLKTNYDSISSAYDAKFPPGAAAAIEAEGSGFEERYVPLGSLRLNMRRLNENVVHLRHPSGSAASKFPTRRVSPQVSSALRSMTGGKLGVADLEALSPDERRYVHKVANASGLLAKLDIPAPKMDEEAQMTHRFEVLKGELMAGGDSPELVREFKMVVLKMAHEGLLPKGEVREILMDLLSLGH